MSICYIDVMDISPLRVEGPRPNLGISSEPEGGTADDNVQSLQRTVLRGRDGVKSCAGVV